MAYTAYVSTKDSDSLTVRSRANGEKIDVLTNGTEVIVTGEPVHAGEWNWVQIGTNRWIASEFITTLKTVKVVAKRTTKTIGGGLRVYETRLINSDGNVINTVRGVSGRVSQQTPSHTAGSQTPVPFGIYTFTYPGVVEYKGGEFGDVWSPVTPTFNTARSELGIHYDPSAFKQNANTGTAGCFATPTVEERDLMTKFIRSYKPTHFVIFDAM